MEKLVDFSPINEDTKIPLNLKDRNNKKQKKKSLFDDDDDDDDDDVFNLKSASIGFNRTSTDLGAAKNPDTDLLVDIREEEDELEAKDWDLLQSEAQSLAGEIQHVHREVKNDCLTDWDLLKSEADILAGDLDLDLGFANSGKKRKKSPLKSLSTLSTTMSSDTSFQVSRLLQCCPLNRPLFLIPELALSIKYSGLRLISPPRAS